MNFTSCRYAQKELTDTLKNDTAESKQIWQILRWPAQLWAATTLDYEKKKYALKIVLQLARYYARCLLDVLDSDDGIEGGLTVRRWAMEATWRTA
jgi:hypothetical protein